MLNLQDLDLLSSIPCLEQPTKAYLTAIGAGLRLSCSSTGGVVSSNRHRGPNEQWYLITVSTAAAAAAAEMDDTIGGTGDGVTLSSYRVVSARHHGILALVRQRPSSVPPSSSWLWWGKKCNKTNDIVSTTTTEWQHVESVQDEKLSATGETVDNPNDELLWKLFTVSQQEANQGFTNEGCEIQVLLLQEFSDSNATRKVYQLRTLKEEDEGSSLVIECDSNGRLRVLRNDSAELTALPYSMWKMEAMTGELCHIQHVASQKLLSCNWCGDLSLQNVMGGWEVWRVVELNERCMTPQGGGGDAAAAAQQQWKILLTSWTHDNEVLSCNVDGELRTTHDPRGINEQWTVEKRCHHGVVIRSDIHCRLLAAVRDEFARSNSSYRFVTVPDHPERGLAGDDDTLWSFSAAHQDTFLLNCRHGPKVTPAAARENAASATAASNDHEYTVWRRLQRTDHKRNDSKNQNENAFHNVRRMIQGSKAVRNMHDLPRNTLGGKWNILRTTHRTIIIRAPKQSSSTAESDGKAQDCKSDTGKQHCDEEQSFDSGKVEKDCDVNDDEKTFNSDANSDVHVPEFDYLSPEHDGFRIGLGVDPYEWILQHDAGGGGYQILTYDSQHVVCVLANSSNSNRAAQNAEIPFCLMLAESHKDGGDMLPTIPTSPTFWWLEPCMPDTLTRGQIYSLGGAAILGMTAIVGAPFAVMGVISAMGFTSAGISAGSMAAGMMSAEAVAGGTGGIAAGGTVATLQSLGAVGLGGAEIAMAMGGGAVVGGTVVGGTMAAVLRPPPVDPALLLHKHPAAGAGMVAHDTNAALDHHDEEALVLAVQDHDEQDDDDGMVVVVMVTRNRPLSAWEEWPVMAHV